MSYHMEECSIHVNTNHHRHLTALHDAGSFLTTDEAESDSPNSTTATTTSNSPSNVHLPSIPTLLAPIHMQPTNLDLVQAMNRMMRESDAFLLEQGVEDNSSAPATPCLQMSSLPEENYSLPRLDLEISDSILPNHAIADNTKNDITMMLDEFMDRDKTDFMDQLVDDHSIQELTHDLEDENIKGMSKSIFHPNLEIAEDLSRSASFRSLVVDPPVEEELGAQGGVYDTEQRNEIDELLLSKTSSLQRRLSEVAQYAKAVGEIGDQMMQVIIDDGESDDDSACYSSNENLKPDLERSSSFHRRLNEAAQYAEAIGEPLNNLSVIIDDGESDDGSDETRLGVLEDAESSLSSLRKSISPNVLPHEFSDDGRATSNDADALPLPPPITLPRPRSTSTPPPLPSGISSPSSIKSVHDNLIPTKSSHKPPYSSFSQHNNKSSMNSISGNLDESEMEVDIVEIKPDFLFIDQPRSRSSTAGRNFEDSLRHLPIESPRYTRDSETSLRLLSVEEPTRVRCDSKVIRRPPERAMSDGDLQKWEPFEVVNRPRSNSYHYFCHKLPLTSDEVDNIDVKGIKNNTLEVTKRGITRGNYAQLHRKAWLEVSDKHHRYGKNLRLYYKHWEKLGHPTNMFFDWLDSKGEAEDQELPSLPACPREILDSDRVLYIDDLEEQERYMLKIKPSTKSCDNEDHGNGIPSIVTDYQGNPVLTGPTGWIFVLRDNELYGAEKVVCSSGVQKMRFHHSSFFGGKAVAAAGILITDDNGCLSRLYPHSGHYRPGEAHMQRMLYHLYRRGVDLNGFLVDMQQIVHVSREVRDETTPKGGKDDKKKAKKTDSLQLKQATFVALFLAHKAKAIGEGLFTTIHKIRRLDPADRTVKKILAVIDPPQVSDENDCSFIVPFE